MSPTASGVDMDLVLVRRSVTGGYSSNEPSGLFDRATEGDWEFTFFGTEIACAGDIEFHPLAKRQESIKRRERDADGGGRVSVG